MEQKKVIAKRSFFNGTWVKRGEVIEVDKKYALQLEAKELADPYETPDKKEKDTKEEKTAYQTKEQKQGSTGKTRKKPGPKPKQDKG